MMNCSKTQGSKLQVNCALGTFLKIYPTTFEISLFPITFANKYSNQTKKLKPIFPALPIRCICMSLPDCLTILLLSPRSVR